MLSSHLLICDAAGKAVALVDRHATGDVLWVVLGDHRGNLDRDDVGFRVCW